MDKDELLAIAQRKEGFLLEFEAEMRAAGQVPDPRPVSDDVVHQAVQTRPPRAMGDRGGNPRDVRDVRDRLDTKPDDVSDIIRSCACTVWICAYTARRAYKANNAYYAIDLRDEMYLYDELCL